MARPIEAGTDSTNTLIGIAGSTVRPQSRPMDIKGSGLTPEMGGISYVQLAGQYGMSSSINVAWLSLSVRGAHGQAFDDAWDVLVVREDWRQWVHDYLIPPSPFLYLAVRDDVVGDGYFTSSSATTKSE